MPDQEHENALPYLRNGIAQVGLVVQDLDRTVECYWKQFGVGPWHIYTYGKPLVAHMTITASRLTMPCASRWPGSVPFALSSSKWPEAIPSTLICQRSRVRHASFRRAGG